MIDTARDGEGLTIDELIYRAAQLDPHPGEWTFPIFMKRAFGSLMPDRYFYELITQFSDLLHIARLNLRLLDAGVPQNFIQGMQAVIQVFPSMWDAPEGRLPLPDADEACLGCHSVAINGWTDDGLIFQNSYGPGWGNNGSGVLTRQYADLFLREAWTSRVGSCGANPYNWHTLMAATGLDLARSWCSSEKASLGRIREGGRKFDYRHYAIVSLGSGCLVQVIEACRRGANKREGWAHLYHFSNEGRHRPVLRELFCRS